MYCNSVTQYSRFKTREVNIGHLKMGAQNPIRIQSMTTTDTMNTQATVAQSIRMIESGCELVRITAPSINEAQNLAEIKKELLARGYNTPLVADIHFTPNAAELAAKIVEKVRVNPGNYADKKKFETIDYDQYSYEAELERIRKRFEPLVKICKEHGTAMRIGTNHGSLSDRILSRYGDTPLGMVESAMEFLRIAESLNYYNIVLSMKASNTQVMVQAYRLLVNTMIQNNMNYPLHLGVTEAGEGEDGRIKSAVGIGTLLEDGIGDTVRVSLTEDPEFEAPVAKALVERYTHRNNHKTISPIDFEQFVKNETYNPYEYKRRNTIQVQNIGNMQTPKVIVEYSSKEQITQANFFALGLNYSPTLDKWNVADIAADFIYTKNTLVNFAIPGTLGIIYDYETWLKNNSLERRYPLLPYNLLNQNVQLHTQLNFVVIDTNNLAEIDFQLLKKHNNLVLVLESNNTHAMAQIRRFVFEMMKLEVQSPIVVKYSYKESEAENFQLTASTDAGALFIDGIGDALWLNSINGANNTTVLSTAFGILQATRTRISKTEYISCPSCGRTLFDLQETTAKIRAKTDHLKGVKIGIMGCIVNGPGEMADADYGYVGVGVDKITLYKGKEVVMKAIDSHLAVDQLIELIKQNGDWVEKPIPQ
jgi:(E)-4-hydroxy-3-methylbut-2-enyl-diphosphate synthase